MDINVAVQEGTIKPNQYLVMKFDFSRIHPVNDLDHAAALLHSEINDCLTTFVDTYGSLLEIEASSLKAENVQASLNFICRAVKKLLAKQQKVGNVGFGGIRGVCFILNSVPFSQY
jgi:hypothetical protein